MLTRTCPEEASAQWSVQNKYVTKLWWLVLGDLEAQHRGWRQAGYDCLVQALERRSWKESEEAGRS